MNKLPFLIANGVIFGLAGYFFGVWVMFPLAAAYLNGVCQGASQ
jgi:Sec-independent protein secretion pathway component TatC